MRWIALATYAVVLFLWCNEYGVPIGHDYIFLWIISVSRAPRIGRTWMSIVHLLIDWGPFLAGRHRLRPTRAAGRTAPASRCTSRRRSTRQVARSSATCRPSGSQQHLYHTNFVLGFSEDHLERPCSPTVPVQWFEVVFDLTYLSHYLASFILAGCAVGQVARPVPGVRAALHDAELVRLPHLRRVPRGAPVDGRAGRLHRPDRRPHRRPRVRVAAPPHRAQHDRHRHETTNLVAAVPSLHAGFATLVAITLWRSVPRWGRPFLALYPVLMGLMLVATGEHYVSSTSSSESVTRSRPTSCGTTSSVGGSDARTRRPR